MAWTSHIDYELERLAGEDYVYTEVTVEYSYSPGRPAVMYLMNGDPGYPAEPAEIEILRVYDSENNPIVLTEEEEISITDVIEESAVGDYEADYADYLYDQHKDRMMEEKYNNE